MAKILLSKKEAVMELDIKKGLQDLHCFDYDHMLDHRDGFDIADEWEEQDDLFWIDDLQRQEVAV
jgi:hypothetical protein